MKTIKNITQITMTGRYKDIRNELQSTDIKSIRTFNKIIKPLGVKLSSCGDHYIWDGLNQNIDDHISNLYQSTVWIYRFDASNEQAKNFWIWELESMLNATDDYETIHYTADFCEFEYEMYNKKFEEVK